ncbi:fimbrillin family protein [Parabacteroides pacaensis]|uniref:fimbrillin family protein n=1 Tax=Parabacteroides pacaensis TaxID=2086575 RepID=UPI000D0FA14D|nr:fimbrillin family protein [Parabacteroides pacaensis]
MKKLMISIFTIAAMVSCTSENEIIDNGGKNDEKVEIKLNAGINVITKAAIESGADKLPSAAIPNVQFQRIDAAADAPIDWTNTELTSFTGTIGTDGSITTNSANKQYYDSNDNKAHIVGYFPSGTVTNGVVSMTIDGTNDVIYAQPINKGNRTTPTTEAFAFNHKLTQFKFVVKTDNASITTEINDIDITIKNANTTFSMALKDGELSGWGNPKSDIGPATMTAPAGGTESSSSAGILLEPNLSKLELLVKASTLPTEGVSVEIAGTEASGKFEPSKAYTITLTLQRKTIDGSATVTGWTDGTAGSGTVE